ncbi:hypothetical protein SR870_16980 [Rhodopseudomonas palustris]|uniref:hypothetical protein n=1 Tax=Rhodopseudomonas palustris TaxID=1076 RepID=UPI002ACE6AA9|nr:hypothetical protein [Rhodopseudomonas palustris]WQG98385.1 hypothetical protein SR870_16980 [Rhodopseudomonas palustris]
MQKHLGKKHLIILGALGVIVFFGYKFIIGQSGDIRVGQMPSCDSSPVRRLIAKVIEESPRAQLTGLKLLRIGEIEDYVDPPGQPSSPKASDPTQESRLCKAVVFTSAGKGDLHFGLSWADPGKTELWLQVTVVTF